ncbi:MAG: sensor histidine kinase [Cyanophyceae cyanobacterium]
MRDIGKALQEKTDLVTQNWIEAVRTDEEIESAQQIAYHAVRDSIPLVLEAISTLLTRTPTDDDPQAVLARGLKHGAERAEQGYDAAEIVREYRLLRRVIFTTLKPDLLSGSASQVLEAIQAIDTIIDEVVSTCLESYLQERLRELERVQGQLMLTNQELTRLVQSQKDNLSRLTHELKNPVNAIMGYSELLLRQQPTFPQAQDTSTNLQFIERLIRNGQQLLRLINNSLEISRCEAEQMQPQLESTAVRSLIEESVEALALSARDRQLAVRVECDRAPETVLSDPLWLRQIVTNLVSNAIRYTDSGTVRVICQRCDDEGWQLVVSDTGVGITPEDQLKIFKPYFRVQQDHHSLDGTGLGLAIVAELVNLLQGKIYVVSQVGKGSTFTVTFPLSAPTA